MQISRWNIIKIDDIDMIFYMFEYLNKIQLN